MSDYKIQMKDIDAIGNINRLFPITKAKYVKLEKDFSPTSPTANKQSVNGENVVIDKTTDRVEEALYKLAMQNSQSIVDVRSTDPTTPVNGQIWITP